MRNVIVRYTLKSECLDEHLTLLAAVFEELGRARPAGLRYGVTRSPDGLGFTHIASMTGPTNPLAALASFQAFTRDAPKRCEAPPQAMDVTVAGDYGLFS
jgi:hypothetical protein